MDFYRYEKGGDRRSLERSQGFQSLMRIDVSQAEVAVQKRHGDADRLLAQGECITICFRCVAFTLGVS